jgi:hypothetical protein
MSYAREYDTDSTVQQTLFDAAAAELIRSFPDDIILRYEPSEALQEFLQKAHQYITYLMLNFSDVERLIKRDGTLYDVIHPSYVPIICAAEQDQLIYERQYEDIWRVLEACQPAIYVPDAGKVYVDEYGEERQRAGLREYKMRLNRVMEEIDSRGWNIEVVPIAKGIHRWHFEELKPCYERHEFENYMSYTKQFVGANRGNRFNLLKEHLQNLIDVMSPANVFAISQHGATHLERLQPEVTGASGILNFAVNCKREDGSFSVTEFLQWRNERRERLTNNTLWDYE